MMKVKDLIEMLQKLNPEAEIIPEPTDGMRLREQYSYYEEKGWKKEEINNDLPNRSKYIENLVRKDMEARGKNVDREF